jgi:hypothetical protein
MEGETSTDTVMERLSWLSRSINIPNFLALHEASLTVQRSLNDTIPNSLCNNVLRRFLALQFQAYADISKGNSRVGQGHHSDTGFDDVLSEAQNESVRAVTSEGIAVLLDGMFEFSQLADSHGLNKLQIRCQWTFHACEAENSTVRNITHQQLYHKQ